MKLSVFLSLLALPAVLSAQSLGDAARKESERRQKNKDTGVKTKAYTEGDLAATSGRTTDLTAHGDADSAASKEATASSAETAPTRDSSGDRRTQEESWRRRVAQATSRRDEAKKNYDTMNSLSLVSGEYYVDENGKPVITSLGHLRQLIAKAKSEYESAQKALDDLMEQARRANIPPGWLR